MIIAFSKQVLSIQSKPVAIMETKWIDFHYLKIVRIRRFSGPYFPAFGLKSKSPYSVRMWENTDQKNSE